MTCSSLGLDAMAVTPGTCGASRSLFRCGSVDADGNDDGWFGHCLAPAARCDGAANDCGDNSDEANCALPRSDGCSAAELTFGLAT